MLNFIGYFFGGGFILFGLYLLSIEKFTMKGDVYTRNDMFYWLFISSFIAYGLYVVCKTFRLSKKEMK
jgi:hypothetical protein